MPGDTATQVPPDGADAAGAADAAAGTSRQRRLRILDITARIGRGLDFEQVAQRIVDAVTDVTDFRVATLTVREGDRCRRVATGGLPDGRIGMTTGWEEWSVLLRPEWRRGSMSYLVPPEAPAQWADVPDIPASDDPDAWTAEHGLVLTLLDHDGQIIGFVAADEPRSGRLPDDETIEMLEVFAGQAQVALTNAHLYDSARRQAQTMAQLFDVAKAMATTADFDEVVPRIVAAMHERFEASEVAVARVVDGRVHIHRSRDVSRPPLTAVLPLEGPVGALAQQVGVAGTLVVSDVALRDDLQAWVTPGTRSLLLAGRTDAEALTVALSVASERPDAFAGHDREFLAGLLDITVVALRNAELYEEVRFAAERDALTGLRNRRVFWSMLAAALADAASERPVALAMVDIDDFKLVNDRCGHAVGDRALVHVATRLMAGSRQTDTVFRVGGEEFVVVMPDTSAEDARSVLQRIARSVKRSRLDVPALTISAGVATAPAAAGTAEDLFRAADAALYRAKHRGKDRIELADGGV